MARVAVLGAGISGHTAALLLRRQLSREHEVVGVSPNRNWSWIPFAIWVDDQVPGGARLRPPPGRWPRPALHLRRDRRSGSLDQEDLHHMFIYKAKALPGWWLIPE